MIQVVKSLLRQRGLKVTVSIFWGRGRYVRVLWPYIERNLASNMGIIDEVLLITFNRDRNDGEKVAHDILESAVARFPHVVREVPFCPQPYGALPPGCLSFGPIVLLQFSCCDLSVREKDWLARPLSACTTH
jgi:hypothetical protein